jgi:hypothetical protein
MISIMTYSNWRQQFTTIAGGRSDLQAQVWNLEHEDRIVRPRAAFKRRLGQLHRQHQAAGLAPGDAALSALNDAIGETRPPESKWLGKVPLALAVAVPSEAVSHVRSVDVAKKLTKTQIDEMNPPRQVKLHPLHTATTGGVTARARRFVWITWAPPGSALPDDPTQVKCELGLAHYQEGTFVYRCPIAIDRARHRLFVPTCLDAGLYWAWSPPPPGLAVAWGLTRDMVTGAARWPELLVEGDDLASAPAVGELVGPGRTPIAHVDEPDYMLGR